MQVTIEENGVKKEINPIRVTYDKEADAVYIYLVDIGPGEVKFSDPTNNGPILDYNKDDQLIGIEILDASKTLPQEVINHALDPYTGK